MSTKLKLTVMSFLQFAIWGSWLITISVYWFNYRHWSGLEFGATISSMGIASIITPALVGIIADKWVEGQKLYGVLHLISGAGMFILSRVEDPVQFYWVFLATVFFYIPTLSLQNSISYHILTKEKHDLVKVFPPIRVWGTIGFILAMWLTNLSGNKASSGQFLFSAVFSIILGIYSFSLPRCKPEGKNKKETQSFSDRLGLKAFSLFKNYQMAIFFLFSMMLGIALQLTNMYGDTFLNDFALIPAYADSVVIKYSTIFMSISQISETLFILAIPFFMKRFGIKTVVAMSFVAWFFRFILFAYGDPGNGLWMIILSMIVYGMAFDFYNISGSLFIEQSVPSKMRASAQGIFFMISNGIGGFLGSILSGAVIQQFFTNETGQRNWQGIWTCFAIYVGIVTILFLLMFNDKKLKSLHTPAKNI